MNKIILTIIITCLAGCTLIPHYDRPSSPVPDQFSYTNAPSAPGSVPAAQIGWQDFFKDPRLQELIGLALQNNRDYRVALLNVQQVHDQYRIVQYALLPSFALNGSALREREIATSDKYVKIRNYGANLNTSYEVDLFGNIRSLQAQAVEQYLATKEASRAAQISLVSQVASQYLIVLALDQQEALAKQTLESVQSYDDLISKSYQYGNSSALDLQLALTQVQTAQADIANYERQRAQAMDALMLLVGQALPDDLPQAQSLSQQNLIEDIPVGLSSDLLEQRPDILEAEHNLKAANDNIGIVRANFFPTITLTASDGTASVQLAKIFKAGTNVWSFSPQISLPLFNQNTNFANLNAAWVGQRIEIAQYEKTIQTAFKEVSDAIIARDTYNQQIMAQRGLVQAEQERFNLTSVRYKEGIDNYLTVLLAQQDLYTAQANLIQVSLDRFTNLISLYKALGGGWKQ